MKKEKKIIPIIIIIILTISISFSILFSILDQKINDEDLYYKLYEGNYVYEEFNNESLVNEKTNELIGFFDNKNPLDETFYTSDEISHLEDVKKVLKIINTIYYILLLISFIGLISLYYLPNFPKHVFILLISGFFFSLLLILILYFLPFDILFEKMHSTLFPQGNYTFDSTSNMIRLFPEGFFIGFFKTIIISFILKETTMLIAGIIGISYLKKH